MKTVSLVSIFFLASTQFFLIAIMIVNFDNAPMWWIIIAVTSLTIGIFRLFYIAWAVTTKRIVII